jgi:hypothetical protein
MQHLVIILFVYCPFFSGMKVSPIYIKNTPLARSTANCGSDSANVGLFLFLS